MKKIVVFSSFELLKTPNNLSDFLVLIEAQYSAAKNAFLA